MRFTVGSLGGALKRVECMLELFPRGAGGKLRHEQASALGDTQIAGERLFLKGVCAALHEGGEMVPTEGGWVEHGHGHAPVRRALAAERGDRLLDQSGTRHDFRLCDWLAGDGVEQGDGVAEVAIEPGRH